IMVNANMVEANMGRGITVSAVDTAVGDVSISMNTLVDNVGGDGISLDLGNTTVGSLPVGDLMLVGNTVTGSAGDGINLNLDNRSGIGLLDVSLSSIGSNMGGGVVVNALDTTIDTILFDRNTIVDNVGGDGLLLSMTNGGSNSLTISNSS